MEETVYFLSQDESCQWYLIPEKNRQDWYKFLEIPDDDPKSWDVPSYAEMLDGSPENLTFKVVSK